MQNSLVQPRTPNKLKAAIRMRLVALREEKKLKQSDVAKRGGISTPTVKRMEAKKAPHVPRVDTLAFYLRGCDATLGEFFAPWIRPGTTDYDRECHSLLLEALANDDIRGSIRNLLKSVIGK